MKPKHKPYKSERGFTLIELMIVIAIIGILIGVGVTGWKSAVRSANEAAAIKTLRAISEQEMLYYNSHNRSKFGTFDEMLKDHMLDERFAGDAPVLSGYIFTIKVTPKSNTQQPAYAVNADPQQTDGINATGKNHFYIDSNSNIRINEQQQATATDPPLQ